MLYIWLPFVVLIAVIAIMMFLNISINLLYITYSKSDTANFEIYVKYAFFKYHVLSDKKEKKAKANKKHKVKVKKEAEVAAKTSSRSIKDEFLAKNYSLSEIIEIIKQITQVLIENFGKYLKLKIRNISIIVATDDAQKTAITYGTIVQSVQYLYEFLNENFKVSQDTIKVYSDFSKTHMTFDIDLNFRIKLWQIIKILLLSLIKYKDIEKNNNKK